jgi:uncharacterized protein YlaI
MSVGAVDDRGGVQWVHEYLQLERAPDGGFLRCAACEQRLCPVTENYRLSAHVTDAPVESLGPLFEGMGDSIDERIVFRTYSCPNCRQRLDAEVCPESAEALWDLELLA